MKNILLIICLGNLHVCIAQNGNKVFPDSIILKIDSIKDEVLIYNKSIANDGLNSELKAKYNQVFENFDIIRYRVIFINSIQKIGGESNVLKLDSIGNFISYNLNKFSDIDIKQPSRILSILSSIDDKLNELFSGFKSKKVNGINELDIIAKVEVRVVVLNKNSREISGYNVSCESYYLKNEHEEFNPTNNAIKNISVGPKIFKIQKGKRLKSKYYEVKFGDKNTHIVYFQL